MSKTHKPAEPAAEPAEAQAGPAAEPAAEPAEAQAEPAAPVTVVTTIEDVADFAKEAEGSSPYGREPEVVTTEFANGTTEQHYV